MISIVTSTCNSGGIFSRRARRNRDNGKAALAFPDDVLPKGRLRNKIVRENQAFALVVFGDGNRLCHNGNLPRRRQQVNTCFYPSAFRA